MAEPRPSWPRPRLRREQTHIPLSPYYSLSVAYQQLVWRGFRLISPDTLRGV